MPGKSYFTSRIQSAYQVKQEVTADNGSKKLEPSHYIHADKKKKKLLQAENQNVQIHKQ